MKKIDRIYAWEDYKVFSRKEPILNHYISLWDQNLSSHYRCQILSNLSIQYKWCISSKFLSHSTIDAEFPSWIFPILRLIQMVKNDFWESVFDHHVMHRVELFLLFDFSKWKISRIVNHWLENCENLISAPHLHQ